MTLTVAVDLDGVSYPLHAALAAYVESEGLVPALPVDPSCWTFWRELGMSDEQFAVLLEAFGESGGYRTSPPIPEALEGLGLLFDAGFDLIAASSRPASRAVESSTYGWVADWFLPFRAIILGPTAKLEAEFDVLLDDNPAELVALADLGEGVGLLVDRPWNQEAEGFARVTWEEIPSVLDVLAESVVGVPRGERSFVLVDALEEICV